MAVIFPERLPESIQKDPKRSAERRVYEALMTLSDKFTVYYSVAWQSRSRYSGVYDGEADFVIAHPDFGVIVLEVKGGRIAYDARLDQWTSIDRNNQEHLIKDPAAQALNSAKTLLKKFQDLPGWGKDWLTIGHGVVFPNVTIDTKPLRLDLPSEILISASEMEDIPQAIQRMYDYYATEDRRSGGLGYQRLELVDNLLARSFRLETPLGVELSREDARLIELTEQQMGILDILSNHPRAAIQGCAGSGKTMLAFRKAELLSNQGFEVLLTCFNHALADNLARRTNGAFTVMNFHALCRHFANDAGFTIRKRSDKQDFYNNQMPDALLDAIDELGAQFDAIIVDEGQDFRENWWLPLSALLHAPEEGIFYVFFDDNQNLYRDTGVVPGVIDIPPYALTKNCRNTQHIHHIVAAFHNHPDQIDCLGPYGREPEIWEYRDDLNQIKHLGTVLHTLVVEESISSNDIVILTPKAQNRTLFTEGMPIGNFRLTHQIPDKRNKIQVSSIHTFKGLERRLVILAEIDRKYFNLNEVLYVGSSRARTHLILLVKESFVLELEEILQ